MNKGLWIARKNHLWCLIKKVSDGHGGDDITWLRKVFNEILESHPDERIEEAVNCFTLLAEQLKYYKHRARTENEETKKSF